MPSHQLQRKTEDVRRELTAVMRTLKDPRINGMISIVNVDLSNDLSHCTVYISSLEGKEQAEKAVEGLTSASGYIKREIGKALDLRRLPEFHFVADDGIEYSAKIHEKLNRLTSNIKEDDDAN